MGKWRKGRREEQIGRSCGGVAENLSSLGVCVLPLAIVQLANFVSKLTDESLYNLGDLSRELTPN